MIGGGLFAVSSGAGFGGARLHMLMEVVVDLPVVYSQEETCLSVKSSSLHCLPT